MKHWLGSLALALTLALVMPTLTLAQQQGQSQGVQIQASSLIGSAVRGTDGKDLGKVADVMIDPQDGRIASVLVSMGGTLGMGAKQLSVPWNAVQVARDQERVVVTLQQQVMPPAPRAQDQQGGQQSSPSASPSTGQGQPPAQGQSPQQSQPRQ